MARIRCAQTEVAFNDPEANSAVAVGVLERASIDQVDLVLFPEAFLTGYCVASQDEAESIAIRCQCDRDFDVTDAHGSLVQIQASCVRLGIHAVLGLAAKDDYGIFNAAVLIEPSGRMRRYIKTHLPCLGFDRFAQPGSALPVFETELGVLGILICYDLRPPEATRVLALRGAEIVLLPTNWPTRKGQPPSIMVPARCAENRIYYATCNRVGDENGFSFRGDSGLYDLDGTRLCDAGPGEGEITADLDLALAREKTSTVIPELFSTNAFADRRPDLYSEITARTGGSS